MRPLYLIGAAILFASCQKPTPLTITGTTTYPDGSIISVNNDSDSTLTNGFVDHGKFKIEKFGLEPGYYTFSAKKGDQRADYDIYLEPGAFTIALPAEDGQYLGVKTLSATQNQLTDYYNFENNILNKFRQQTLKAAAAITDPKNAKLNDADFQKLVNAQAAAKSREYGAKIAAMHSYIDKHPQTSIILHIIQTVDYKADPASYQIVFDRLSPAVKNSPEGRELKENLANKTPQPIPVAK